MPIFDLLPWNRDKEKYAIQKSDEFDPFDIQQEMNRMFDRFMAGTLGFDEPGFIRTNEVGFIPRLDISESDQELKISVDLPGMDEKDIHLAVENYQLIISGEKHSENEEKNRTYHRIERRYGSFYRTVDLPDGVDTEKIDASFKKGVLVISIPKSAEVISQKKRIPIKAG